MQMQGIRKEILKYSLDYNIVDVSTYSGYKGDLILKITSHDKADIAAIRKYALSFTIIDVVVKLMVHIELYELYCVITDDNHHEIVFDDIPTIKKSSSYKPTYMEL